MTKEELKEKIELQKKQREEEYNEYLEKQARKRIPFDRCEEGYAYNVDGRNFDWAIFYKGEFYGIRYKFGRFIDSEMHWDKDDRYGTVTPLKKLEKVPDEIIKAIDERNDIPVIEYLDKISKNA